MIYYPELNKIILSEPHFLIGGTPGSGKSVFLNTAVRSMTAAVPCNVFLLDPKRVEFSDLARLSACARHETTTDGIYSALLEASGIMERRYREMERRGQKFTDRAPLFVVIDEVADLMLSPRKREIADLLQHIAQLGRAANIRMLIASQVIRADILSLKITSNINGRVALRCRNALESRLILGEPGAEFLPRYGEALIFTCDGLQKIKVPMYK